MREITIVTGFFDIGRDKYAFYSRSVEKYLDYFRFWARIQNQIVVYTMPELAPKVMEIRGEFGLADKTVVIEVADVFEVEPALYERMAAVELKSDFHQFRANADPEWPDNKANYDYIMLMKYWCLYDAVEKGLATGMLAWLDFGFNHGGKSFSDAADFDYLWQTDLEDKVHLFSLSDPNKIHAGFQLQFLSECLMGAPVILPDSLADDLWNLTKKAMEALVMLDCIDDDQQLLMMSYRERPEIFDVHLSDWFMPMKEYGGQHLKMVEKVEEKRSFLAEIKLKLYFIKRRLLFCKRIYDAAKRYKV